MPAKPLGKIQIRYVAVVFAAAFVSVFVLLNAVGKRYAEEKAVELVNATDDDVEVTANDFYTVMLLNDARAAVRLIGEPAAYSRERMLEIASIYSVDEINIADRSGRWIASTEDPLPDLPLADAPATAEYLKLLDGSAETVTGRFRASVSAPCLRAKYAGVPFPGGRGLLQMGVLEKTVGETASGFFECVIDGWKIGQRGFVVYSEKDSDRLVSGSWTNGLPRSARTLSEAGIDEKLFAEAEHEVRSASFCGIPCWVKVHCFAGRRILLVLPFAEYQDIRIILTFIPLLLLAAVFSVIVVILRKVRAVEVAEERLREIERARLDADIQMAAAIQHNSLPHSFPPFPDIAESVDLYAAMRPARDVGGDFYDFRRVGADRLLVAVADVSDKGISAAMFMMRAKVTLIGECSGRGGRLGDGVASANRLLCQGEGNEMFVTAWVGLFDFKTGRLSYVSAGHNPPVLRHADGSVVFLSGEPDLPLAAMEDADFTVHETRLSNGDLLFAYTDGVTEASDRSGSLFGDARLLSAVADAHGGAREACEKVVAEVSAFTSGAPQSDDITVLALRMSLSAAGDALGRLSRRKFNLS